MIRKHCEGQECLEGLCCPRKVPCAGHSQQELTPLNLNFNRSNRISLKRFKNRQQEQAQFRSPPSQQPTKQPSFHTLPPPPRPVLPKIAFSWSSPAVPLSQEAPPLEDRQQAREALARRARSRELKKRFLAYRNSIVSIKSGSSFKDPRFEESLILVDYFHPSSRQLDQMQHHGEQYSN